MRTRRPATMHCVHLYFNYTQVVIQSIAIIVVSMLFTPFRKFHLYQKGHVGIYCLLTSPLLPIAHEEQLSSREPRGNVELQQEYSDGEQ